MIAIHFIPLSFALSVTQLNMYQVDKIIDNVKHELYHHSNLNIQHLALIPMSDVNTKVKEKEKLKLVFTLPSANQVGP